MTNYDSLTRAQRRIYDDTVSGTHFRRVELEILTLNAKPLRSMTNRFTGGQVDTDTARTPAAVLSAGLIDDDFVLDWQNGEHRKHKARVIDSRFIPDLGEYGEWVEKVVFTGPFWDFDREGALVSVVAQGTERLAMGSVRHVFEAPRKSRAIAVVRDLLLAAGAVPRLLVLPMKLKVTLPEDVIVGIPRKDKNLDDKKKPPKRRLFRATHEDTYVGEVQHIIQAIDRLFYTDGWGRFVVRGHPAGPVARVGNRQLVAPVKVRRSVEGDTTNTWEILGANPKGPKARVRAVVAFPKRDPLSAQSLAWHGKPHELIETVENKHLKTIKQARTFGLRLRDRALGSRVEYEVQMMPTLPWLEPHQIVSVPTPAGRVRVRATRWTLPLGPGADPMTIGANRKADRR